MSSFGYTLTQPKDGLPYLILTSPHSGREYPETFDHICSREELRQNEDFLVDRLLERTLELPVTLLAAKFPRSYIDLNRALDDLDPKVLATGHRRLLNPSLQTRGGLGLIHRVSRSGHPIYRQPLSDEEVTQRISQYYEPYHQRLANLLQTQRSHFGASFLLDCHSMPSTHDLNNNQNVDFSLGSRDGSTCDPWFSDLILTLLQRKGYRVSLNDRYKGKEIVRRYGHPKHACHALQLEIKRSLYMDECSLSLTPQFMQVQNDLGDVIEQLIKYLKMKLREKSSLGVSPQ